MAIQTADNKWATSKWIVDPTAGLGDFTTISDAMTKMAAIGGGCVVVKEGTYTEDFTIPANTTLTSYIGNEFTPSVSIVGKITFTTTGTSTISGIRLQTNSDYYIVNSGSNTNTLNIENCFLYSYNNTGINLTNANGFIQISNCFGDIGTSGKAHFSMSNGSLEIFNSHFKNNANSTQPNTISGGGFQSYRSFFANSFTTSNNADIYCYYSRVRPNGSSTPFILNSSGNQSLYFCHINSGTNTAISIGGTATLNKCLISSTNTVAISGAGTLYYNDLSIQDNGNKLNITTTTQTPIYEGPSKLIGSSNSGGTNSLTITNASNTASSAALCKVITAGSTASDPQFIASTTTTDWSFGVDNSDFDSFVLSQGTALGTNNLIRASSSGIINYPLQCSFAYASGTISNVTGDGTEYTCVFSSKQFDQNDDFDGTSTFTAPIDGIYYFFAQIYFTGITSSHNLAQVKISAGGKNFYVNYCHAYNVSSGGDYRTSNPCLVYLTSGQTAQVKIMVSGGTKVVDLLGNSLFGGQLLA